MTIVSTIDVETTGLEFNDRMLTVGIYTREDDPNPLTNQQTRREIKSDLYTDWADLVQDEMSGVVGFTTRKNGYIYTSLAINTGLQPTLFVNPVTFPTVYKIVCRAVERSDQIVGHNFAFDLYHLNRYNLVSYEEVRDKIFDTMTMSRFTGGHNSHSLDDLIQEYRIPVSDQWLEMKAYRNKLDKLNPMTVLEYVADDVQYTMDLYEILYPIVLETYENAEEFIRRDGRFVAMLARMRSTGMYLNKERVTELLLDRREKIKGIRKHLSEQGINGPNDARGIVKYIKSRGEKIHLTEKRNPKTDVKTLSNYPGVKLYQRGIEEGIESEEQQEKFEKVSEDGFAVTLYNVLKGRSYEKQVSTWLQGFLDVCDGDGRVHPLFSSTTKSSRLSARHPNVLAVDRDMNLWALDPKTPYNYLVELDYKQAEVYLAAIYSMENAIAKAISDGQDIHTATAALMFSVPYEKVTKEQRRQAKGANFGSLYGGGVPGLSSSLGVSPNVARNIITMWRQAYGNMYATSKLAEQTWLNRGYVELISGKRRYVSPTERTEMPYAAFNQLIQSSVAELIIDAMLTIEKRYKPVEGSLWPVLRIICQIHDSLYVEMVDEKYIPEVVNIMTGVLPEKFATRVDPPIRLQVDHKIIFEREPIPFDQFTRGELSYA